MQDHETARIEHLKLLNGAVERMAGTSAAMKRYALVIAAAALALAGAAKLAAIPGLAAVLMLAFWALDAQYLRQERWFRRLYDAARREELDLFVMTPDRETRRAEGLGAALTSWATLGLYLPVILFLLVCGVIFTGL
jgi:hypothetical protein